MTTDARNDVTPRPRDADFYFSLITFEVENALFRVPRHPFEIESEVFKGMFTLPVPSSTNASADGIRDEKPLILHGIAAQDFRVLLTVLFDPAYGRQKDLTQKEWSTVLHLTHMWNFDRIFNLAIQKLEAFFPSTSPAVRITQAKSYGITKWLRPAYFELAMRTDPLTVEEADKLGVDCMVKMVKVRELRYRWIIEDGNLQLAPSTPVYHTRKGKGKGKLYGYYTQEPPDAATETAFYISQLERAVHGILTEVFGID